MARRITTNTLNFLKTEAASGIVLGLAALAALLVANSPLAGGYFYWLKGEHILQLGPLVLQMTISEWIKEGLMAIFFLVVGLEIKYEILKGELSDPRKLATPVLAAIGGMIAPALVYLTIAGVAAGPHEGWPVPLATDIAFALAVFAIAAKGLPSSLRVFLLTLAIVDDLGAIALIAVLFSSGIDWVPLAGVGALLVGGAIGARMGRVPAPFWVIGFAAVWYLTVLAGLSTSLTAVAFALIVPVGARDFDGQSPLKEAMHDLHPYVAFLVLPLFAFAKAGVSFAGLSIDQALAPLVVGIALGLFVGKQIGVFGMAWLASKLNLGAKPTNSTWL
ncbi:MAG: Na+/H+ antiporter NhaA, partial [Cypionkella sp.]